MDHGQTQPIRAAMVAMSQAIAADMLRNSRLGDILEVALDGKLERLDWTDQFMDTGVVQHLETMVKNHVMVMAEDIRRVVK